MKYRDEPETIKATGVMMWGTQYEEGRDEKLVDLISESLRKELPHIGPGYMRAHGRIQFVATVHLTVIPEFGLAFDGQYARVCGEFEREADKDEEQHR